MPSEKWSQHICRLPCGGRSCDCQSCDLRWLPLEQDCHFDFPRLTANAEGPVPSVGRQNLIPASASGSTGFGRRAGARGCQGNAEPRHLPAIHFPPCRRNSEGGIPRPMGRGRSSRPLAALVAARGYASPRQFQGGLYRRSLSHSRGNREKRTAPRCSAGRLARGESRGWPLPGRFGGRPVAACGWQPHPKADLAHPEGRLRPQAGLDGPLASAWLSHWLREPVDTSPRGALAATSAFDVV
jgi:hypothetical protein